MQLVQGCLSQADGDRMGTEYFDPAYSKREMLTLAAWVLHELPATAVARLRADPKVRPWSCCGGCSCAARSNGGNGSHSATPHPRNPRQM
jgi:hypothetical protein